MAALPSVGSSAASAGSEKLPQKAGSYENDTVLGVIGGTGLYALDGLTEVEQIEIDTPFGPTSSPITSGRLHGVRMLFIARHGIGHVLTPTEVPYRANIYALKALGAKWCLSVSAVGSLTEEFEPRHLVVPDQLIDRTRARPSTFFGGGLVAHVSFADPFCSTLRTLLIEVARKCARDVGSEAHDSGTYVCMEGPAFSTRAESHLYRSWGAKLIGMTALPEAKLAREAEIAYATLALVTDYDCWRSAAEAVEVAEILETLGKNSTLAKTVVSEVARRLPEFTPSTEAACALDTAIITDFAHVRGEVRERLGVLLDRYLQSNRPG